MGGLMQSDRSKPILGLSGMEDKKRPPDGGLKFVGGGGGIRTPGRVSPTSVFKTDAFNHSATPPKRKGKGNQLL